MNKYLVEFIGTFFLVLVICLTGGNYLAPLAIGSILMVMVYFGGHISGAQYNPAVTLAVLIKGKMSVKDASMYVLFQVLGAIAAALLFNLIWGKSIGGPRPSADINILKALAVETVFTFALVSVVLAVAVAKKTAGNNYYGLAIGFTVMAAAIAGGGISGGAYNPAVAIGPMLIDTFLGTCTCTPFENLWIYLVGPFSGATAAALAFNFIHKEEA